jgi:adenylate cyclase
MDEKLYASLRPKLDRKIVMIGQTGTGATDIGPCSIHANTPFVHMHMTAASNILTGTFIQRLSRGGQMKVLFVLWFAVLVFAIAFKPQGMTYMTGGVAIIYFGSMVYFFWTHQYMLPIVGPLAFLMFAYVSVLLYHYLTEEREKKQIRTMFSTMVSGDVLEYMTENPESFSLSGERRDATMFFSDVAGFTTISESLTPERLVALLNAYLSPMTDIIMESGGYVDKYEGDAIMAEWGVPQANPDHAKLACWAALDQQKKLAELNPSFKEEFGFDILVRMGINSGSISAGNMGSQRRFSYTVMGDAVNQAARFEPANKDYDTLIMMGESTFELARDHIEARLLDKVIVKGKTVPIKVFELIAKKGEIAPDKAKVVELYHKALDVHWERDWDGAIALLEEAIALVPDDGPSIAMKKRIEGYKEDPPGDDWQGEFVRTTK